MRYIPGLQFGSIATLLLVSAGGAAADPAHKTPKECNSELYSRLAAIKAAGETPSRFVHDCWWHSQPGQPTAIVHPDAAVPPEAPRQAEAAPPPRPAPAQVAAEHHVAAARHVASAHRAASPRQAGARLAEAHHRREHRVVEARRLERLKRRIARVVRAARVRLALERHAAPHDKLRAASRWSVAANEIVRRRLHRERLAEAGLAKDGLAKGRLAKDRLAKAGPAKAGPGPAGAPARAQAWADRPIPADVATATADLGPTARAGRRMWVQVVAAGKVGIKPAVAVGGLAERASAGALNCWGQPVLLVGHDANRWSREMVCDGKPAGANEWSATIYYGGPAAR